MINEERVEQVYVPSGIDALAEQVIYCEETMQEAQEAGWDAYGVYVRLLDGGYIEAEHIFEDEPEASGIVVRLEVGESGEFSGWYDARPISRRRWICIKGHGPMPTPEEVRRAYREAYAEKYSK